MSARGLVEYAEARTRLDIVAITDHDDLDAALEAEQWALARGLRVQVLPGVEVTTREGHLLVLFVQERPPALRPAMETMEWAREHGAICLVPHPFSRLTHSLAYRPLVEAVRRGLVAGVESLNASPAGRTSHTRALAFSREHSMASVGGSDAHMLGCVGLAYTRFPGRTVADLRLAIETRTTVPEGRFARAGEIAAEAMPQLARSMVHLPLRRVGRAALAARARWGARAARGQQMLEDD